jgi:uridine kinase
MTSTARAGVIATVAAITAQAAADVDHPLRLAVDGITASGKTTFARELTGVLVGRGLRAEHVTMDGFHHPAAVRHRRGRDSAEGYYGDAYDVTALRARLLDPLGPGGDRRYRTAVIDLATDQPVDAPARVAPDDLVVVLDGSFLQRPELAGAWDLTVFLSCPFELAEERGASRDAALLGGLPAARRRYRVRYHAAGRHYIDTVRPDERAGILIDHADPDSPVMLRVPPSFAPTLRHHETRRFFTLRASTWDERFPDDGPAFAHAVDHLDLRPGHRVLDAGCGTGRALPLLAGRVAPGGLALGVDLTPAMAARARTHGPVALADTDRLPFADRTFDAVLAAGLTGHLPDPRTGLRQLARVTRPGGRLALFHPVGRAALAARRGHTLSPDDVRDPRNLPDALGDTGWHLVHLDDGDDRYLAVAERAGGAMA